MQTYLIDFRVLLTIAAMMNSPAIQMTIRREAAEPTTLQEGECEAEANRHAGGHHAAAAHCPRRGANTMRSTSSWPAHRATDRPMHVATARSMHVVHAHDTHPMAMARRPPAAEPALLGAACAASPTASTVLYCTSYFHLCYCTTDCTQATSCIACRKLARGVQYSKIDTLAFCCLNSTLKVSDIFCSRVYVGTRVRDSRRPREKSVILG